MCPVPIDENQPASVSKDELRALGASAMQDWARPVTKLPTVFDLRCACGHRAKVAVQHDHVGRRFRCSRCGSANVRRMV